MRYHSLKYVNTPIKGGQDAQVHSKRENHCISVSFFCVGFTGACCTRE